MSDLAAVRTGPLTTEDAISILQKKIEEKGSDGFRVKVQRQASLAAPLTHVATLSGATIDHLASPETWLVMLAGGGPLYVLTATHMTESMPTVTFRPPSLPGTPREVDPKIANHGEWKGPPEILFPGSADKAKDEKSAAQVLSELFSRPPGSESGPTARGDLRPAVGGAGPEVLHLQMSHGFELIARALDAQAKSTERQIAILLEGVKAVGAKPAKSMTEQLAEITPLIAAVSGILTPLLLKNREAASDERKRASEDLTRREEREAKSRAEVLEMLRTMSEKSASASADVMKITAPMVDAIAQMGRTVLQQVATMRELSATGEQDESLMSILKAGVAAFGDYMAAKASGSAAPPLPQLPPAQQPSQPTQPAQPSQEDQERIEHLKNSSPDELLGEIEGALKTEHDAEDLAGGFLDAMAANTGVAKAVTDAGGVVPLFRARLGDAWITEHTKYVQNVIAILTNSARKRGMKV